MRYEEVKTQQLPNNYKGYLLKNIWEHNRLPFAWDICNTLIKIPAKITAFIQRDKIIEVRKSDCYKDNADNYYLVKLIDNTYLELAY